MVSGFVGATDHLAKQERINSIKVAFVLNIARFVNWPDELHDERNDKMHLCVYRTNTYGKAIKSVAGQAVGKYDLEVRLIDRLMPEDDCEILLIPFQEHKKYLSDISGKAKSSLLTILDKTNADELGAAHSGVIVSLVRQGQRIVFEIDPQQANEANLRLSSELLKLARIVGGN